MIYMSDSNGNLIPFANDNQGREGLKMDLLWENTSPTTDFAAQTISVPNLINYDYYMIMYTAGTSSTNRVVYYGSGLIKKDYKTRLMFFTTGSGDGYKIMAQCREMTAITSNSMTFGNNSYTHDTTNATRNDLNIPVRVYGVK